MIIRKGLATGTTLALAGVTLVSCGCSAVKKTTIYEHKYSNWDAQYAMSVLGCSTNIERKVGSIKIISDQKYAYVKNIVYYNYLYNDGLAEVEKISNDTITFRFKLEAGDKQSEACVSAKLPKNDSCLEIPLGYDGYILKFNRQTK